MGVPNFRIFSPLRMRADLNNFWWTWEPRRRTFKKKNGDLFYFWQKNKFRIHNRNFRFANSDFFLQKKKFPFFFGKFSIFAQHATMLRQYMSAQCHVCIVSCKHSIMLAQQNKCIHSARALWMSYINIYIYIYIYIYSLEQKMCKGFAV